MLLDFRRCSLVFLIFRLCSFIFVDVCRFPQIFRRCQWILSDFRWLSYCRGHGSKNDRSWPKLAPDYTEPQNTHLDTNVWMYNDFRPRRQWSYYIWPFEKIESYLVFFEKVKLYLTILGWSSIMSPWAVMDAPKEGIPNRSATFEPQWRPMQTICSAFRYRIIRVDFCSDDESLRRFDFCSDGESLRRF